MARIVLELDDGLIRSIRQLMERGRYASMSDFLWAAAQNQLVLEDSGAQSRGVTFDNTTKYPAGVERVALTRLPQLEKVTGVLNRPTRAAPLYNPATCLPAWGDSEPIWGQINRIFPCKVGARVLANMTISAGNAVRFERFLDVAAQAAAAFGLNLQTKDTAAGRKRDEAYSVGLPTGKRGEANFGRSLERFKNHFLADIRGDHKIDGALARLKFVGLQTPKEGIMIALTEAGWQFAQLPSPALDGVEGDGTLSEAEKNFYIDHVIQHVPAEAEAMETLLRLIADGINNRGRLNLELTKRWESKKWSSEVVNTQRSGLTARMVEVGLLAKRKQGLEVVYMTAEASEEFLVRMSGQSALS